MHFFRAAVLLLTSSTTALALPTDLSPLKDTINTNLVTKTDLTSPRVAAAATTITTTTSPSSNNTTTTTAGGGQPSSPSNSTPANGNGNGNINAALVPTFGVTPNTNPGARGQAGSCDGFLATTNAVVAIPCTCPPSRTAFLAALGRNVAAGRVVLPQQQQQPQGTAIQFSNDASDQSVATNKVRATAMVVTLQNLFGPGVGCPAASAPNFAIQQRTGEVSSKVFVG